MGVESTTPFYTPYKEGNKDPNILPRKIAQ